MIATGPPLDAAAAAASRPVVPPTQPAGWYADPQGIDDLRWWDGGAWTDQTRPDLD